ncbi:putative receptor-like protein kinase [Dorcoceras hygrometricum]|uniref:Putative receptor-like protein kinase n=1 Tax=Dorcoceras hygrometricum TaxID=472368 RepID=A0A2Z7AJ25_9LAMI|nr:putative receptor-like protein kinase [Dorcoceras hygrometricum]
MWAKLNRALLAFRVDGDFESFLHYTTPRFSLKTIDLTAQVPYLYGVSRWNLL